MAEHPLLLVFPLLMIYAATLDVLTMRIANGISIALVLGFLLFAPVAGMPMQQMLMHLGAGVAVLLAAMLLFHLRLVGGGDAKLVAAAAVWIGYDQLSPFLVSVTIFGGIMAVLLLAYRWTPVGALPLPAWAARLHKQGEGMPYGVAIAAGALVVYPVTGLPMLLAS